MSVLEHWVIDNMVEINVPIKYYCTITDLCILFQDDQVPDVSWGPEKSHPARNTGIHFHSPEFSQNLSMFFNIGAFFVVAILGLKLLNVSLKLLLWGWKKETFTSFYASARKDIWGKMVTLYFICRSDVLNMDNPRSRMYERAFISNSCA